MIGAVDIGGTKIAVGLVTDTGQLTAFQTWRTAPEEPFETALEKIHYELTRLARLQVVELEGVGCSITGQWDPVREILGENAFLPNWSGKALKDEFESVFGLPAAVDNDAVAAAVGEYRWGTGQGTQSFIYVTVSTGIGCGIVLNGSVLRGAGGAHGESGHQVIDANAECEPCFCGARGCWESLASGSAFRKRWQKTHPDSDWGAKEICAAAREGDTEALEAVALEGCYLGIGLGNLITLFVPEVIALGGGVMESFDLFEPFIREQIETQCGLVPWQRTKLIRAHYQYNAALVGAAGLWQKK